MRRALLAGVFGLLLAACASASANGAQRYSGVWDWHFETSAFTPDGGEGPYWLSGDGAVWDRLNAPFNETGAGPWGRAHLIVEGTLSPPGRYGHLGAYTRELRVTRVIEARLISARENTRP
jgi:hypothetical protein